MNRETLTDLIALRRDLHRHPEPRFHETRTARILSRRLSALGFDVVERIARTGVVGTRGSGRGPHVLVRADMDALPTHDLKTVEYASSSPGVAHACGHDIHCVVALGAAGLLAEGGLLEAGGRVTVLFQPAEEIPFGEVSGAQAVLDSGALDVHDVDAVLAVHCWPQLPAGTIGIDPETAMAAKLAFRVSVTGHGAHAATPQLGRDALLGASQIVVALHTLVGRDVDPNDRVAVNVGTVHAGTSQSIVPAFAELSGTVRSVHDGTGARLRASVERVVAGVAAAHGLVADVEWRNEMPPVANDPRLVGLAHAVLTTCEEVDDIVQIADPPMTTDDFALFAQRWPGLYLKLGVAAPGSPRWPALHDGAFDVDERCVSTGAHALATVAAEILRGGLHRGALAPRSTTAVSEVTL